MLITLRAKLSFLECFSIPFIVSLEMALQWVLLLVMAFTGTVTSHRPLALGSCPTPAGMADFDKTQVNSER